MTKKKRNFQGMSYRVIQINNSENKLKLYQEDQFWLKKNGYKNVGWNDVISLYEKIAEFLQKYNLNDLTLEELFLEADRIGNKYQTIQEITDFNQKLAVEVNEIAESIDTHFPDTEIEFIDFSNSYQNKNKKKYKRNSHKNIQY
ncbi:hypothetical protein [Nostoc parmelioides]|uniref:Uncharacterized protein n=1 Tax=Nostoc parmelioides FACHB-3921 TaxID=2692909 RepID=A0ABR8BEK6_9NOSO|nr:hypothetical protein [Nostoc parmelioides]MBD2251452.1 hypothetical protein [Nostoc parmelioides FACHB-3921]